MSNDISKIDKNFAVESQINKTGMNFFNVLNAPFKVHGVFMDSGSFCRLPISVAKTVSQGVDDLNYHTAGGRVRFKTNSSRVAIITKQDRMTKMSDFTFTGAIGFDIYVKIDGREVYKGTFIPPFDVTDGYESVITLEEVCTDKMNEIIINFPLYGGVRELLVGVNEDAQIAEPDEYKYPVPVLYYGSSITQGGCATRPGNSYQAMVSRELDCDYINLGFSGNAKAEDQMMDYMKNLKMSVFVYDYDHNAPSLEHLEATHEKGYKIIRESNPDLPIIFMSRPKYYLNQWEKERLKLIKATYDKAVENGDKNVYFIDGPELMAIAKDDGTVDGCHPNDLGFYSMAAAVTKVLKTIL